MLTQYTYDSLDRVISETRSGPGMMTETTTYDYTSVDPADVVPPVDSRPRTVVRKLNGIECERTYYVYSPLTNIVERVGTQGAVYGGTSALRTVTAFYPIVANDSRSGLVASIRHEDGKLDIYDYALVANLWTETVTHLHEQSPAPVSGKTTRDITIANARGETTETRTEAYIDGIWYTIARNRMTYNSQGKRTSLENLAGRIATKVAQGKGGLGLRTDMAYTVKHIQKGQTLLAQIIEGGDMQFDKFSKCKKMIYLLLVFQLLCCCGVLVALKFEMDLQTICLLARVLRLLIMVIGTICVLLSILLVRYSRCPNCGKSVLMRIDYKRIRQMKNGEKIECPHCKSIISVK